MFKSCKETAISFVYARNDHFGFQHLEKMLLIVELSSLCTFTIIEQGKKLYDWFSVPSLLF